MRLPLRPLLAATLTVLAAACGGDAETGELDPAEARDGAAAELAVANVNVGTRLEPDGRIAEERTQFAPGDTVRVVVSTTGVADEADLTVRWTDEQRRIIDQETEIVSPRAPAIVEFDAAPAEGWRPGSYAATILLNGREVERREFVILGGGEG